MPINQGRSFFLTINNWGLKIRIPISSRMAVIRSLQKARPTADIPLSLIMRLMNIPEVAQQRVAVITIEIPDSLVEMGFGECWDKSSSLR